MLAWKALARRGMSCCDVVVVHTGVMVELLLDVPKIDVCPGLVSVENLGDFFERRAFGLGVKKPDEPKFNSVPERVKEHEIPVTREVVPGDFVCLTVVG